MLNTIKSIFFWLLGIAAAVTAIVIIINAVKIKQARNPSNTTTARKVIKKIEYELVLVDDSKLAGWAGEEITCYSPQDKNHPGPDKAKWAYVMGKKDSATGKILSPTKNGAFDTIEDLNQEIGEHMGVMYRIQRNIIAQALSDTWDWFASLF